MLQIAAHSCAFMFFVLGVCIGSQGDDYIPPNTIYVYNVRPPETLVVEPFENCVDWEGMVVGVNNVHGRLRANIWLTPERPLGKNWVPGWLPDAYKFSYRLKIVVYRDDLIALFGAIYRVTDIGLTASHKVIFERVKASEIPNAVTVEPRSYVFPYRQTLCDLYVTPVYFHKVINGERLAAMVAINPDLVAGPDNAKVPDENTKFQTVRVGDMLRIDPDEDLVEDDPDIDARPYYHKVLNIVPPDPKNHVVGWIELDTNET